MPLAVGATAPALVYAGDSYRWLVPSGGLSASAGYSASLRLVSRTTSVTAACTADGDEWVAPLSEAHSAALGEGDVTWAVRVTGADGTRTIADGRFTVRPVPKAGDGLAGSTYNERMLALWESRAEQQAQDILAEYDVGGRRAKRYTPDEIRRQLTYWRAQVARERAGGRNVAVQFQVLP